MPMRFPDGYPWWTFPTEKIADFTITGRSECVECGGKCCSAERNLMVGPVDRSTRWTRRKALARLREEGEQFVLGRQSIVDGQPRWRFGCRLSAGGGCSEAERPEFCRNFPMTQLADAIAQRKPFRRNHWCRLARNLREEYALEVAGP